MRKKKSPKGRKEGKMEKKNVHAELLWVLGIKPRTAYAKLESVAAHHDCCFDK